MEEFSFHTTTADSSSFASIDSPPLWHLSPAASPVAGEQNAVLLKHDHHHHDLFQTSGVDEAGEVGRKAVPEEEEDEKMDLLWEDLNDDLLTTTTACSSSSRGFYSEYDGGDVAEMGCFQALSFPRGNAAAVFAVTPTKRPTFLVFMKFLRRMFLVHASPLPLKRPRRRRLP